MSVNLAANLERTAARSPTSVAVKFEGRETTYADLEANARRFAAGLAALGVGRGDRVALWLPNHPAFIEAMYGVWRLGAVVVPVHAMLTEPEVRHILKDSGAKVVFCGPSQLETGERLAAELVSLERAVAPEGFGTDAGAELSDVTGHDLALIAYTAGTSGVPKGAMLTHGNLRANLEQMRDTPIAIQPDDAVLCFLPLFHIFGLNVVVNLAVDVGAKLILFERFDPVESLRAISTEMITVVAGAPPAYVVWLQVPDAAADAFASVRVAVSGAAPLAKEVLKGFRDRFGLTIWEGYGLTETSPALTWTAIGGVAKAGSVGRPLPGVELRLIDEDGSDVDDGDPGEIVVRGPNVFTGYWSHPEASAAAFLDGWFRTGDVGVLDDDGDLFIVDRRGDMIIVSGFNVYPREVEDVLRRHPKVGDCAVVGEHDERSGESVRAIVVADPPGEEVTPDELVDFCRRSLAPYKVPVIIEIVPEIPRNAAGKVLRRLLRHT